MELNSEESCRNYLESQDPSTIAKQIRRDQQSCRDQKLPSLLAWYLPPTKSELANAISIHLSPGTAKYGRSIRLAQYQGIIQGIKGYLEGMTATPRYEELPNISAKGKKPSEEDIRIALKVLGFYHKSRYFKEIHNKSTLEDIVYLLQTELKAPDTEVNDFSPPENTSPSKMRRNKNCYICRLLLVSHHPQYPSLCNPCGDFNLTSSNLSLPTNLKLDGRTALITGSRINLGYHTALRMLRCGAKVIVTTRYPRDANVRYLLEKDSSSWSRNLQIIGADFRSAADVFELIRAAKNCLKDWSKDGEPRLDILINNAAQTLTDPLEVERYAVKKEHQLTLENSNQRMALCNSSYIPRVRGTVQGSKLVGFEAGTQDEALAVQKTSDSADSQQLSLVGEQTQKSSWMQSISQIPYEDVISAHSVNTFVPLILIREFFPFMGTERPTHQPSNQSSDSKSTRSVAYIVNVSSREGIFELSPSSRSKNGHHVHTNLTKAALNMLTETEAEPAWRSRRVAMNTVDPGYMSAAPEIEHLWREKGESGECPIGWEDGAGRVLWPIAVGESGKPVWGRFLKHFGKVEVDVGWGGDGIR